MKAVLSLDARDAASVRRAYARYGDRVDLFELRLDACAPEEVAALVREAPRPVIATVMPLREGGGYAGAESERRARLAVAAQAGASYVDVDRESASSFLPLGGGARPIVSVHDREERPAAGALEELRALSRAFPRCALKRVYRITAAEEAPAIYAALRTVTREHAAPVIAFSMGEPGRASRLIAGIHGSAWTYLAPDEGEPTAPGQWKVEDWEATRPAQGIDAATRVFGVVGASVARSLSPAVHGAWFRELGWNAIYLRFEPRDARPFFDAYGRDDASASSHGFSVTIPFKEAAWKWADEASADAAAMQAANTLVRTASGWRAENTDAPAVRLALERAGARLSGKSALVLGAGGAARAAALALRGAGARVAMALREPARAAEFAALHGLDLVVWSERADAKCDVLVNATPLGGPPDVGGTPYESEWISSGSHVLDMVYRPRRTALLRAAERAGAVAIEGLEMFLEQARLQTELFTGTAAPLELLRAAAERELAREEDA